MKMYRNCRKMLSVAECVTTPDHLRLSTQCIYMLCDGLALPDDCMSNSVPSQLRVPWYVALWHAEYYALESRAVSVL